MAFKQSDVKIHGHSVEYRVYAEDPSRKFLPSIGFLKKYKEPTPHENIRIDTGVQEGSEISMYYDPMISKLITWGKNRKEALELLGKAMDEYVIRGVVHNVGFGRSILRNESFAGGSYSTSFIPTFYPQGFKGDPLSADDHHQLAIAAHFLKNHKRQEVAFPDQVIKPENTFFVTIKGEKDLDFKIEKQDNGTYTVTDVESGKSQNFSPKDFDFDYNSLLRFDLNGDRKLIQFLDVKTEINYSFYYKGNTVEAQVFDAA